MPPRIVFFGPPNTGKTALLHAFADPEAPVSFSAKVGVGPCRTLADGTVLCDVDGRSAAAVIDDPDGLRTNPTATVEQITAADAVVLVLDASADNAELLDLFRRFGKFLDGFEATRSHGLAVGGLPVFLTLTKCDTLCRPGDDVNAWHDRVQSRTTAVKTAFEDYLGDRTDPADEPFGFGSIDVQVAATALHFPRAFTGYDGPFGVDELHDRCLTAATDFCERRERSGRRLRWTLAGTGSVVSSLALLAIGLVAVAGADSSKLAERLRNYRDAEGPPAVRLADRVFEHNHRELQSLKNDPAFPQLPPDDRDWIDGRLTEYADYQVYRDRFRPPQPAPDELRSLVELTVLESALNGSLKLPAQYDPAWIDTDSGKLWQKWHTDTRLIRTAEADLHQWYRGRIREATALTLVPTIDADWKARADALLTDDRPPFAPTDVLKDSPKLHVRRGAPVTYAGVFEFDRVEQAKADWADTRDHLTQLRDLSIALGLTGTPNPILELPEPSPDVTASERLASDRMGTLPDRDWRADRFPDPIREELLKRLRRTFDTGVRHVHAVIRSRMPGETAAGYVGVAAWLETPAGLAWGRFLGRVGRWAGVTRVDPATEAVTFLKQVNHPADLTGLELTIPDDLRDVRVRPAGELVIVHTPTGQPAVEYKFRAGGESRRGSNTVYQFHPIGFDGRLTFRPGDGCTASVPMTAGGRTFPLDWGTGGSVVYGFDKLTREPVGGVSLSAAGLPRLPVLLPGGR